jgi:hypothetical protein
MAATLTSIAGLQNIINLQDFRADYNSLSSIDLSGMTNLIYVDISDNDLPGLGTNSLSSINLTACSSVEQLYLDDNDFSSGFPDLSDLTSVWNIDFDDCGIVGSIDVSNLPSLKDFDFSYNEGLTELIISSTQPLGDGGATLNVNDCALTQTAVDNILVALANNSISNGIIYLQNSGGGTNATPSRTGLDALYTLVNRGWGYDIQPGNHTSLVLAYETVEGLVCASTNVETYFITAGSTVTVGNKLYGNSDVFQPAINGWYSDGSIKFQVTSNNGLIASVAPCV